MKAFYDFLIKRGQAVFFGVGLLLVILYFVIVTGGLTEFNQLSNTPTENEQITSNLFNFGLYTGAGLIILCVVLTIILGIVFVATNIKSSLKLLIAVAAILVLFLIFKATSGGVDSIPEGLVKEFDLNDSKVTLVGGALRTAIVLMGLTVLAFIGAEVRNLLK